MMKLPSTDAQASDTSGSDNSQTLGPDKIFARLRLTADDLEALKQQGTVQAEWRGKRLRHTLRFRRGGKQVVRYVGDSEAAGQLRETLACLQRNHRNRLQLAGLALGLQRQLRESKRALAPHLAHLGYAFHGLALRKTRRPSDSGAQADGMGQGCP